MSLKKGSLAISAPLHSVYIGPYIYLATEQTETYRKSCILWVVLEAPVEQISLKSLFFRDTLYLTARRGGGGVVGGSAPLV